MPELPEVDTIRSTLQNQGLVGQSLVSIESMHHNTLHSDITCLIHQKLLGLERRGKYLLFNFKSGTLTLHLRMSGRILLKPSQQLMKYVRAIITFSDQVLYLVDPRKFARMQLIDSLEYLEKKLGVEPLSKMFTFDKLKSLALSPYVAKMPIKRFLLNQKYVAGIGNIYADETLWSAMIHPLTKMKDLDDACIKKLHQAIIATLNQGLRNMGTSLGKGLSNFQTPSSKHTNNKEKLHVYGKQGMQCSRCDHLIIKNVTCGRGTHICPKCQTL